MTILSYLKYKLFISVSMNFACWNYPLKRNYTSLIIYHNKNYLGFILIALIFYVFIIPAYITIECKYICIKKIENSKKNSSFYIIAI